MNLDDALQTFILESRELLQEMEDALLNIEASDDKAEAVNAIFRAAHTIKGSSGLFGLDHIVAFTHVVESLLDEARDGKIQFEEAMVVLLLSCCDHLTVLVDAVEAGNTEEDPQLTRQGEPLLAQLQRYLDQVNGGAAAPSAAMVAPKEVDVERMDAQKNSLDHWHISLRFGRTVLQNGMDPISFLRFLRKLGRIVAIATLPDAMPPPDQMDPEECYLGFEIAFESTADKAAIEAVFEFVQDDCAIRIIPPNSLVADYVRLISELPETPARLGEILVNCGSVTKRELDSALAAQSGKDNGNAPLGAILVERGTVQPAVVEAALVKQSRVVERRSSEAQSVRVDASKLDHLIDLVGELIIAGARASMLGNRLQNAELQEATSAVAGLVQDVRDAALELRMVKIGATFGRFQRVVHDVAREIGKDIGLSISGEDSELDKTVVEKIADPLMHLVRNAVDHGIESADIRVARGKPAKGTVSLNAFHDSGSIVIEVGDDGGGLKKDRILAKAIERGLIDADRKLTDSEIYNLIFEPGFSTAEQITNLSGRGVGMDVVKRNITALRGQVSVDSNEGVGTTVSVRLPLTLAIIDGFLVQLGNTVFVIPLDTIEECIEFGSEEGHDYANLRGQVLPYIRLRQRFGVEGTPPRRESIVVIRHAGQRAGLVVDTLLGEFQTVIKPLSPMFNGVDCISGSTILGNGDVALILDVAALLKNAPIHGVPKLAA